MNIHNHIRLFLALAMACAGFGFAACSDEWDKHYEGSDWESNASAPTLWELIKSDPDLEQFQRVVEYVGYDKLLASPQAMTLWAPVITESQADSVIAVYDRQRSRKDDDNTAITQFVQNHIALYPRSVAEATAVSDSVRMLNGKYLVMTGTSFSGVPYVRKNVVASNGIFYKLASAATFCPNVREFLSLGEGLDSLAAFYEQFDEYVLDETNSVERGIKDGKIVYADSVLTLSNSLHRSLGWINREDSTYVFLAPTNDVWAREYERYRPLFNYSYLVDADKRDSIADINARYAIIRGRVFNMNIQRSVEDSIFNTQYVRYDGYYGLNVFSTPYVAGGILEGLTPWRCSNGEVYIDSEGRIDPTLTFLENRYIAASSSRVRSTPQLYDAENTIKPAVQALSRSIVDSVTYQGTFYQFDRSLFTSFLEVDPLTYTDVTNRNTQMYFYLPNTFSNIYYNVYVVMMPAFASADGYFSYQVAPLRFQVYYNERLATARTTGAKDASNRDDANDDLGFSIPRNDVVLRVADNAFRSDDRNYITSATGVDVICIDKARRPALSYYNAVASSTDPTKEAVMRYRIQANVTARNLSNGTQTNVLRIAGFFYIPFETEEEALQYEFPGLSNIKAYNVSL